MSYYPIHCANNTWYVEQVNFGHLVFPKMLDPPAPRNIGEFSRNGHQVRSGDTTILNAKQIQISDLHYDGRGPGMRSFLFLLWRCHTSVFLRLVTRRSASFHIRYVFKTVFLTCRTAWSCNSCRRVQILFIRKVNRTLPKQCRYTSAYDCKQTAPVE